jgi:RND superfamily putative drug exporter
MKQVGVGLSVAVLFDAVVLRILILPSVMTLLGERCWWPRRGSASSREVSPPAGRRATSVP